MHPICMSLISLMLSNDILNFKCKSLSLWLSTIFIWYRVFLYWFGFFYVWIETHLLILIFTSKQKFLLLGFSAFLHHLSAYGESLWANLCVGLICRTSQQIYWDISSSSSSSIFNWSELNLYRRHIEIVFCFRPFVVVKMVTNMYIWKILIILVAGWNKWFVVIKMSSPSKRREMDVMKL